MLTPEPITINYTNHRGERSLRRVLPTAIRFGATEYHTTPQWLLEAFDVGKQADRTFAMRDIDRWSFTEGEKKPCT